jgi:hypothetical protein
LCSTNIQLHEGALLYRACKVFAKTEPLQLYCTQIRKHGELDEADVHLAPEFPYSLAGCPGCGIKATNGLIRIDSN